MRNWLLNRRIPNGMYGGVRGRETNLVSHLLDRVRASGPKFIKQRKIPLVYY